MDFKKSPKTEKIGMVQRDKSRTLSSHRVYHCFYLTYKFIEQDAFKTESEGNEKEKRNPNIRIEMFGIKMMTTNLDNVLIKRLVIDELRGDKEEIID